MLPVGFVLCWAFFCTQLFLAYYITAGCIRGSFHRRDIVLLPVVMLTIAGSVAYTLRTALVFAPEVAAQRTEVAVWVACLGQLLGVIMGALVHRRRLIQMAAEARSDRQQPA